MRTAIETPSERISEWKVVKGGLVVGACLLGGQALGFIRQVIIAYLLGTGPQADALAVAFAPVDLWWAVFATTIIFGYGPVMASQRGFSFRDLARPVVRAALLAAAFSVVFARTIVEALAPGLPAETASYAAGLLRLTALAIPAVSFSVLFTALLYSERRFAFGAFQHGMVNISTIAAALALHRWLGAFSFVAGYAAGAWLQLAAAFWISRPILKSRSRVSEAAPAGSFLRGPAPVLFYSLLIGLNPVVTRALASTFGSGSTAAFDYCLKLVGVPLALLVTPLSSSLLSEIAPFRQRHDRQAVLGTVGRAAVVTSLVSAALVVLVLMLAPRIVALLFERGEFGRVSTATVSSILTGFFPVLVAWSVLDVISRAMFSLGRPRIPIFAAALALTLNIVLSSAGIIDTIRWIGAPAVVGFLAGAIVSVAGLRKVTATKRGA